MIRTADAAGFSAVILLGETADIYSPKVMRSMQGSNFHLPLVRMAKEDCFAQLKKSRHFNIDDHAVSKFCVL